MNLYDNYDLTGFLKKQKPLETSEGCVKGFLRELEAFQNRLKDNQEMLIQSDNLSFRLEAVRHTNTLVILEGSLDDNTPIVKVCNYHQLNVLFFATPKRYEDKEALRIGFSLETTD